MIMVSASHNGVGASLHSARRASDGAVDDEIMPVDEPRLVVRRKTVCAELLRQRLAFRYTPSHDHNFGAFGDKDFRCTQSNSSSSLP
jgi:hypothetical protein